MGSIGEREVVGRFVALNRAFTDAGRDIRPEALTAHGAEQIVDQLSHLEPEQVP